MGPRIWDVSTHPAGRLRALAHARGPRQPQRRDGLSADLRPPDYVTDPPPPDP